MQKSVNRSGKQCTGSYAYYGWGIRDTQYIHERWHEIEQMPFDGTGIIVAIDRHGWQVMCHPTVGQQGRGGACVRS
jgi:hypothetical protein